jgi:tetratricopeptide (TPR) repeat protein
MRRIILGLLLLFFGLAAGGCQSGRALTPTPEPLAAFWERAEPAISQRRYGDAVEILEQAASLYPADPAALLKIGQIYLSQQRWLLAEDAFNRALSRAGPSALARAGLAEALLNQGRAGEALDFWRQAAGLDPQVPGVFSGLGRTYLALFDVGAAEAAFSNQLEQRPDFAAHWYLAALQAPADLEAAREHLAAIPDPSESGESPPAALLSQRDYLRATLAPFSKQSPPAGVAKASGIALAQIGLWPLASHALEVATAQTPADAEALAFLAYARSQAGQPALALFDQAGQADPNSALPLYLRGIYLRQQGVLRAAEAILAQAGQLDPENAAIYVELARVAEQQGNLVEAEDYYRQAAELAPDELEFTMLLLRFYANRNYNTKAVAIPLAERLAAVYEDNAELYDLLGWMQFLAGDPTQGETALRQALTLDPSLISARYHLARYLEANGFLVEAGAEYQKVIDWETSGPFRDLALKDLQRLAVRGVMTN